MPAKPVRIGLTSFLRFISATGLARVNAVTEALQDYREWKDYYKDLRDQMILALKHHDPDRLERFLAERGVDDRSPHYAICVRGLIDWMNKTEYTFIHGPKQGRWEERSLRISVNPEVALAIGGTNYIVKIYLAKGSLSQPAQRALGWLIREVHGTTMTPALLEVRKGRLLPSPKPSKKIGRWVRGEAQAFLNYVEMDDDAA